METADRTELDLVDLLRNAYEAVTLADLGARVLPSLERALGADAALLYRSTEESRFVPVADSSPLLIRGYVRDYYDGDPFHEAWARAGHTLAVVKRMPDWPAMFRHPLYGEYCPAHKIDHYFHMRLTPAPHLAAGSVNVMLLRANKRSDFGDRELVNAARALSALEVASRRCLRAELEGGPAPVIEAILEETDEHAHLAISTRGRLLWCSRRAAKMLGTGEGGAVSALPDDLLAAARRLCDLIEGQAPPAFRSRLPIVRPDGARVTAELRLARTRGGEPFVAVVLSTTGGAGRPRLDELRERHGLTQAEADVLGELAQGGSNGEIARRRGVSVATIRTHVVRVLEKLGVDSRLRAALMVTGAAAERA